MNVAAPTSTSKESYLHKIASRLGKFVPVVALGLLLYYFAKPAALSDKAWLVFVVFVTNIFAIILKPLPMGALSLIAISFLTLTKTLPLPSVLTAFSTDLIWLIVMACFLARSFIKTGLGRRIAYNFVALLGGSPIGLSYGLLFSSACMAPLVPSATARTGGIILPVLESLIRTIGGKETKTAQLLTLTVFHSSVITSAMFVTANAGNPIVVKFAKNMGIDISWGTWALAAALPALISLLVLPFLLRLFIPCSIENGQKVRQHAKDELSLMGKISLKEAVTLVVFATLLFLWACGSLLGVGATEAAFLGVSLLLLTNVLQWKDILAEEIAWDTFLWMATLVMLASELQALGVVDYFTNHIASYIPSGSWQLALAILCVIYFYSHYFFASTTAHLSSMYGPLLAVSLQAGAPPLYAALTLGFISNLFGGLTHYSSGPAPILFAQGHVDIKTWWKLGFITSIFYIVVWLGGGAIWCKLLNLY